MSQQVAKHVRRSRETCQEKVSTIVTRSCEFAQEKDQKSYESAQEKVPRKWLSWSGKDPDRVVSLARTRCWELWKTRHTAVWRGIPGCASADVSSKLFRMGQNVPRLGLSMSNCVFHFFIIFISSFQWVFQHLFVQKIWIFDSFQSF